jgi:hypothetical protein
MLRLASTTALLATLTLAACGDDGGGDDPQGLGNEPGGTRSPATEAGRPQDCSGAFASVPSPYTPNTTVQEWGGFLADERGLVFSVIPDGRFTDDAASYPAKIMASSLAGEVTELYTTQPGEQVGPIFSGAADDVYLVLGLLNRRFMRLSRAGGTPEVAADAALWAGPVSDGQGKLYYAAKPGSDGVLASGPTSVFEFDTGSGNARSLAAQGNTNISAIALDGRTLYWVETDGLLAETDYRLFKLGLDGGSPEQLRTLPNGTAIGSFAVVDGVAFGTTLTSDFSFEVHRTPLSGAPEVVEDRAGVPLVIADGRAYYGSSSGLTKNTLAFDAPSVVESTRGTGIGAIAVGPSDLWYAIGTCIYRTSK